VYSNGLGDDLSSGCDIGDNNGSRHHEIEALHRHHRLPNDQAILMTRLRSVIPATSSSVFRESTHPANDARTVT
jgi:hypothetical protein